MTVYLISCNVTVCMLTIILLSRYLNAVRAEDILEIRSDVIKKGNKLAFATVDVIRKSDNQLVAVGRQTKYL